MAEEAVDWRTLVAIGLVAGDLSPLGVARAAGVHLATAEAAVSAAAAAGVLDEAGRVDELTRLQLIADLPDDVVAEVHAVAARRWFAEGPDHAVTAIMHARAAGSLIAVDEMVAMADHGGRMSLSVGDYRSAHQLLELAAELDHSADFATQSARLCDLAVALDGLGDVTRARSHLMRAVTLGELAGRSDVVVRAAVQHALPADWYMGNPYSAGLLQRAESVAVSAAERSQLLSARALTENRVPLVDDHGQQYAWVTRTATAQRFADEALALAADCDARTRLIALLAWRTTHRGPQHLDRRREISTTALQLADECRDASLRVEAAIMLCVDALESGDRPLYDQSLAVVQWVAQRDGNPRLLWRARTTAAGSAYLDGEFERGRVLADSARTIGSSINVPGWMGADFFFVGQHAISVDDPEQMPATQLDDEFVGLLNPIGRAGVAYMLARCGATERATKHVRHAIRQLDEESSYLMLCTRLAAAAAELDDSRLQHEVLELLLPWVDHVAIDSHGWCCDGPVATWAAALQQRLGRTQEAIAMLRIGEPLARTLNDVRSMRRVEALRAVLPDTASPDLDAELTPRELDVLRLLAQGATNPKIAEHLAYSVSTIRKDTVAIYRKLDVRGRTEAVSKAITLGLLDRR